MKTRTFEELAQQLSENGYRPTGLGAPINHIFRREDGREYTVGTSFWGGYEAILTGLAKVS